MDFNLSEMQQMLKASACDFLERECPPELVREMAADERGYSPELWQKMAGLGWMGLAFPEEYGGSGGSFLDLAVLLEEMGRACLPGPFFSSVVLGGMALLEAGSREQKQRFFPQLASGESIFTLAVTEPSASYAADGVGLEAVPSDTGYLLNGTKLFVPDAHVADYIICAALSREGVPPQDGITLFIVPAASPGLKYVLLKTMVGDKQCEVAFNGVSVPEESILGGLHQGWPCLERVLQEAIVAKCAEMVGGAQRAVELTVSYVRERVQYGHPIGSYQAIQHRCADMLTAAEGCRYVTFKAAWMLSEGIPCAKEVAMAKAWVSRAFPRIARQATQSHGAIAFIEDHEMPLHYKRAKAGALMFGNADFHLETVARQLGFVA